jgi:hypothetical protein
MTVYLIMFLFASGFLYPAIDHAFSMSNDGYLNRWWWNTCNAMIHRKEVNLLLGVFCCLFIPASKSCIWIKCPFINQKGVGSQAPQSCCWEDEHQMAPWRLVACVGCGLSACWWLDGVMGGDSVGGRRLDAKFGAFESERKSSIWHSSYTFSVPQKTIRSVTANLENGYF